MTIDFRFFNVLFVPGYLVGRTMGVNINFLTVSSAGDLNFLYRCRAVPCRIGNEISAACLWHQ